MIDMVEMSRRITSHAVFGGVDEVDHFAGGDVVGFEAVFRGERPGEEVVKGMGGAANE